MFCPNPDCPFLIEHGEPAEFENRQLACLDCGAELRANRPTFDTGGTVPAEPYSEPAARDPGQTPLTTLTETSPEGAAQVRDLLESNGIPTLVENEHLLGVAPPLAALVGGVRVRVPEHRADDARQLLEDLHGEIRPEDMEGVDELTAGDEDDDVEDVGGSRPTAGVVKLVQALALLLFLVYLWLFITSR